MRLTNRDKKILRWIEEHKSATITQISKIFFNASQESYQLARKRLAILAKNKYLKKYRKDSQTGIIYYFDKKLTEHSLKLLDVYADLTALGCEITHFKKEYTITTEKNNYRIDGLMEFVYEDYFYTLFIEIDHTHFSTVHRFEDIYDTKIMQFRYREYDTDLFPHVLIVRPFVPANPKLSDRFKVTYMDFSLSSLKDILL